jgi:prolyl 4-hydroxylase
MNKIRYIIIIALLIILLIGLFSYKNKHEPFYELGLAEKNEDYIYPTVYKDFVSKDEAEYIKTTAAPLFKESEVVGEDNNDNKVLKNIRDSKTAWIEKNDPVVKQIIMRVCSIHNIPFENAENLQVVKYGKGGFYREHHDSVYEDDESNKQFLSLGGHRILTMLIYLNDDFDGGATRFVNIKKDIKPPKHGSILFYPLDKQFKRCHPKALHAGLPLESGEKIIANVWLRQEQFG